MKKPEILEIKAGIAWKHTATFLKLVRHKLGNGHLHGNWDAYCFPIIAHFRKTEQIILAKKLTDDRGGDRHSAEAKEARKSKPFVADKLFDKLGYDEELRSLIRDIDDREKRKILS